jgi:hypothetical protein
MISAAIEWDSEEIVGPQGAWRVADAVGHHRDQRGFCGHLFKIAPISSAASSVRPYEDQDQRTDSRPDGTDFRRQLLANQTRQIVRMGERACTGGALRSRSLHRLARDTCAAARLRGEDLGGDRQCQRSRILARDDRQRVRAIDQGGHGAGFAWKCASGTRRAPVSTVPHRLACEPRFRTWHRGTDRECLRRLGSCRI